MAAPPRVYVRFTHLGDAVKNALSYTGLSKTYAWNQPGVYTTLYRDQFTDYQCIIGRLSLATRGHLKDVQEETMITLLLVEDELLVRNGLRMWLEREAEITVVGEASDGTEAITLAQALQPDVVLMDISLPTMDGITAAAAIRTAAPHCAVVFLSLYDDAATRERADAAGAVAFVGKQEGVRALQAAIRQAGRLGRERRSILRGDRRDAHA